MARRQPKGNNLPKGNSPIIADGYRNCLIGAVRGNGGISRALETRDGYAARSSATMQKEGYAAGRADNSSHSTIGACTW